MTLVKDRKQYNISEPQTVFMNTQNMGMLQ